jgi:hypothetical protein
MVTPPLRPGPRGLVRHASRSQINYTTQHTTGRWVRTSREHHCPVCDKPDWCGISEDGRFAICMRVSSEVPTRNGGWLHRLLDDPIHSTLRIRPRPPAACDLEDRAQQLVASALRLENAFTATAHVLGLDPTVLSAFSTGMLNEHTLAFPMQNAAGKVTGIRYRHRSGRKWSERGGREGVFLPAGHPHGGHLLLPEGPTDAAALLQVGFDVVGRPNCVGGLHHLRPLATGHDVVVVADNDGAGRSGADRVAENLLLVSRSVCTIAPPVEFKDVRDWIARGGADRSDVLALIHAAKPLKLALSWSVR